MWAYFTQCAFHTYASARSEAARNVVVFFYEYICAGVLTKCAALFVALRILRVYEHERITKCTC